MLLRLFLPCLLLVVGCSAVPVPYSIKISARPIESRHGVYMPAAVEALFPEEVDAFYNGLIAGVHYHELENLRRRLTSEEEDAVYKNRTSRIYALKEHYEAMWTKIEARMEGMKPEALEFVHRIIRTIAMSPLLHAASVMSGRPALAFQEITRAVVENYESLSADAKTEILKHFPQIAKFDQPTVEQLVRGI